VEGGGRHTTVVAGLTLGVNGNGQYRQQGKVEWARDGAELKLGLEVMPRWTWH